MPTYIPRNAFNLCFFALSLTDVSEFSFTLLDSYRIIPIFRRSLSICQ